jgi:hypothetical protein
MRNTAHALLGCLVAYSWIKEIKALHLRIVSLGNEQEESHAADSTGAALHNGCDNMPHRHRKKLL